VCEVETKYLIEFSHQILRSFSHGVLKSLHGNRPDLLCLGLGVVLQSGQAWGKQHWTWVDARDIRGHRHDGDDTPASSFGGNVRSVITDNDGRSSLVCLSVHCWFKVDHVDFTPAH